MRTILFLFFCISPFLLAGQMQEEAYALYQKGDYKSALPLYKTLHEKNRVQREYLKRLLTCYQQLGAYDEASAIISKQQKDFPTQISMQVEAGYNLQLQNKNTEAEIRYANALKGLEKYPQEVYNVGYAFKEINQLDHALAAYEISRSVNPQIVTGIQEAQIYGEKGETEKMFNAYLDMIELNEEYLSSIQRYTAPFVTDDPADKNNLLYRKILLQRAQNNPKNAYNQLLSWLYVQQKQYDKALIQEKSIYNRTHGNTQKVVELGIIALDNKDYLTAKDAFQFVLDNNNHEQLLFTLKNYLFQTKIALAANETDFLALEKEFDTFFEEFGMQSKTIPVQLTYADYLTFEKNKPKEAISLLQNSLNLPVSNLVKGTVKVKLADILVYDNQFNQALIIYSQVQLELKNSSLAQNARFKVARTSYFKGDFDWANTQLSVLKSSTSQLIANDALDLHLLILNNIGQDSLKRPLELFARAQLLSYQNKTGQSIDTLQIILNDFKGSAVEDDALVFQAELYAGIRQYKKAEANYLTVMSNYDKSILIDKAVYRLAQLYQTELKRPDLAKEYYEKILFNYPSSIYLVDARKQYRSLRGDLIN
jgi:tetratricopeptide (TPR) repeat protein